MSSSSERADTLTYLPVWKAGATAEERLLELAMMARVHPDRFKRFIVAYQEDLAAPEDRSPQTVTRYATSDGLNTTTALGVIEIAKLELLRYTHQF